MLFVVMLSVAAPVGYLGKSYKNFGFAAGAKLERLSLKVILLVESKAIA